MKSEYELILLKKIERLELQLYIALQALKFYADNGGYEAIEAIERIYRGLDDNTGRII